ncbi:Conserved_hypothetical protein [Hexamita inflata]|uniref:Uncharacterized protein n=1 Tax=Hexamita inflata TaxID=28002 RepID=A0AA86PD54_9EUKA|nr:Conserved hypothetical protein [Hexamita inflata]
MNQNLLTRLNKDLLKLPSLNYDTIVQCLHTTLSAFNQYYTPKQYDLLNVFTLLDCQDVNYPEITQLFNYKMSSVQIWNDIYSQIKSMSDTLKVSSSQELLPINQRVLCSVFNQMTNNYFDISTFVGANMQFEFKKYYQNILNLVDQVLSVRICDKIMKIELPPPQLTFDFETPKQLHLLLQRKLECYKEYPLLFLKQICEHFDVNLGQINDTLCDEKPIIIEEVKTKLQLINQALEYMKQKPIKLIEELPDIFEFHNNQLKRKYKNQLLKYLLYTQSSRVEHQRIPHAEVIVGKSIQIKLNFGQLVTVGNILQFVQQFSQYYTPLFGKQVIEDYTQQVMDEIFKLFGAENCSSVLSSFRNMEYTIKQKLHIGSFELINMAVNQPVAEKFLVLDEHENDLLTELKAAYYEVFQLRTDAPVRDLVRLRAQYLFLLNEADEDLRIVREFNKTTCSKLDTTREVYLEIQKMVSEIPHSYQIELFQELHEKQKQIQPLRKSNQAFVRKVEALFLIPRYSESSYKNQPIKINDLFVFFQQFMNCFEQLRNDQMLTEAFKEKYILCILRLGLVGTEYEQHVTALKEYQQNKYCQCQASCSLERYVQKIYDKHLGTSKIDVISYLTELQPIINRDKQAKMIQFYRQCFQPLFEFNHISEISNHIFMVQNTLTYQQRLKLAKALNQEYMDITLENEEYELIQQLQNNINVFCGYDNFRKPIFKKIQIFDVKRFCQELVQKVIEYQAQKLSLTASVSISNK